MSAIVAFLLRTIGIGGCALIGLYVYDWGVPGAERIAIPQSVPLIGGIGLVDIPILGGLTTGRAHSFAADQVKIATAQQRAVCDTRLEKSAVAAELARVTAQRDRERALRRMADDAAAEAADQAAVTLKQKEASDAEVERLKLEAKADKGLSWPTERDLEWRAQH